MASCAELLTPLYDLMVKRVRLSIVIHTDDTTVPVLDRTLPKTRTGRFWDYIGDVRHPYVVYDYTPSRTRDGRTADRFPITVTAAVRSRVRRRDARRAPIARAPSSRVNASQTRRSRRVQRCAKT